MFNRIRYAAHVLSSSPVDPYRHPDIKFEQEQPVETSRASRIIGGLIEVLIVAFVIGAIAAPFLTRFLPIRTIADVSRTTAIVAAILGMLVMHFFENFKTAIARRLKIGARVAPYFGHRITRTIRTLRS